MDPRNYARLRLLAAAALSSTGGMAIKACDLTAWQVTGFRSGLGALTGDGPRSGAGKRPRSTERAHLGPLGGGPSPAHAPKDARAARRPAPRHASGGSTGDRARPRGGSRPLVEPGRRPDPRVHDRPHRSRHADAPASGGDRRSTVRLRNLTKVRVSRSSSSPASSSSPPRGAQVLSPQRSPPPRTRRGSSASGTRTPRPPARTSGTAQC